MLIFVTEDIFTNKKHKWEEFEEDQKEFTAIWNSFPKTRIQVRKEDVVTWELSADSMK